MACVLIVHDRNDDLAALQAALSTPEREIICVHSSDRAIAEGRHRRAAVVVLAVETPNLAAVETARALRWFDPGLPIILVSAAADDDQVRRAATQLKAAGCFALPVDTRLLGERLEQLELH
jgi:DNA-binding response OmpR family regulator